MEKKCFYTHANGIDFYCEMRGNGPLLVFFPDGSNDCGAYDAVSQQLANSFTVLSFDPRGGSRSPDPNPSPVTPRRMADDTAAILRAMDLGTASFYGCSSGGQAMLAMALYYPELCRNTMIHEAALQADTPIPNAGMQYFRQVSTYAAHCDGFDPGDICAVADYDKWMELDPVCRARMKQNGMFWSKYYLGSADSVHYTDDELRKMRNVDVSVGAWSSAWCVYANISTAQRGGFPVCWLPSSHSPHITCPEVLAQYIRETCKKYAV